VYTLLQKIQMEDPTFPNQKKQNKKKNQKNKQ